MILRYTDEELLEGLKQKKDSCIGFIYHEYAPIVRYLVRHNSGNNQDVEDLLHDSLIVLFQRAKQADFRLKCSLKTYFVAISKNLWLQRLERKCRLMYQAEQKELFPLSVDPQEEIDSREDSLEQQRLFFKHLSSLPDECRRILELYCLRISYKEIARLLNYKDEVYVKTRKYTCKNLLRKKILNDPEFQQFIDYEGNRIFNSMD